jgi:X-X-X-Leu-X-X-Gly heptad repeat protein
MFLLGIMAITQGVFAQDSSMNMPDTGMSKMSHMKKDCYLMKDGQMMKVKHGDTTTMKIMDKSVTLNNGATVMTDGTVKMADGTTKMLKEGWYVDIDGKMGMMKKMMTEDKM